jgi:hypothetical protein
MAPRAATRSVRSGADARRGHRQEGSDTEPSRSFPQVMQLQLPKKQMQVLKGGDGQNVPFEQKNPHEKPLHAWPC